MATISSKDPGEGAQYRAGIMSNPSHHSYNPPMDIVSRGMDRKNEL